MKSEGKHRWEKWIWIRMKRDVMRVVDKKGVVMLDEEDRWGEDGSKSKNEG